MKIKPFLLLFEGFTPLIQFFDIETFKLKKKNNNLKQI